jgi:phosphatidylglycerophosphatase A
MNLHKMIATGLGIGFIRKGSGTVAAAVCGIIWYVVFAGGSYPVIALVVTLIITAVGVWSASEVEKYWGVDSNRVVIDEIAGMCISMVFLPVNMRTVLTICPVQIFRYRKAGIHTDRRTPPRRMGGDGG